MGGRTAVKYCNGDDGDEDVDYAPVTELLECSLIFYKQVGE
jgi:hypothetical protein